MTPEALTGKTSSFLISELVGRKTFLIHPKVIDDLQQLKQAANNAGFDLHIASGFRSFEQQLAIWNRKFNGEQRLLDRHNHPLLTTTLSAEEKVMAILHWSALPGASRHHWGTDFDIYDRASLPTGATLQLEPWEYLTGHQHHFYQWLVANLATYHFFFPYQKDQGGVAIEPWHISHRHSEWCLNQLTEPLLWQQIENEQIDGIQVIQNQLKTIYTQYITNISTD